MIWYAIMLGVVLATLAAVLANLWLVVQQRQRFARFEADRLRYLEQLDQATNTIHRTHQQVAQLRQHIEQSSYLWAPVVTSADRQDRIEMEIGVRVRDEEASTP